MVHPAVNANPLYITCCGHAHGHVHPNPSDVCMHKTCCRVGQWPMWGYCQSEIVICINTRAIIAKLCQVLCGGVDAGGVLCLWLLIINLANVVVAGYQR
jgi:hypothetical protein